MRLKVINKSPWPTPALRIIARWVVKAAGIKWDYRVTVNNRNTFTYYGRGGRNSQRMSMNPNWKRLNSKSPGAKPEWPYTFKDRRFVDGIESTVNNRLEMFVWMMLHEACHATKGHPDRHRYGDRLDREGMESVCNRWASRQLIAFRAAWAEWMRKDVIDAMRAARTRKVKASTRRGDPIPIVQAIQRRLDQWESKQKRAANKIKKYKRKLKYYQGRVAAWSSGKGQV